MNKEMTLTYQTRLSIDERSTNILSEYAQLHNQVERTLYKEIAKGKKSNTLKNTFLKEFAITARQFNACKINLEGKIEASKTSQEQTITTLKQKIEKINKQIQQVEKKSTQKFILHQKKRRKHTLEQRLDTYENKKTPLCFGSKKLFHSQFYLQQNGFSSHQEWKKAWEDKRNSEFYVLGSKDEIGGNQTCVAKLQENGQITLRLRLPNKFIEKYGKYLEIKNLFFKYGHEAILSSLHKQIAISYRFKKDKKGWRIFVSTTLQKVETTTIENIGLIGIDLNTDHIACIETDRFGNPIQKKVIPWNSYGKTNQQLKAITGDTCKEIIEWAKKTKKPIVIEKLDFKKKNLEKDKKFSRLLSSFAYRLFFTFITTRSYKNGITIHQVNPAFTSIIGKINYAKRYGLSTHLAAALCIARRHQRLSELPISSTSIIPDEKGNHVAFDLPARNRTKHVWHFWGEVKKKLQRRMQRTFRRKIDPRARYKTNSCDNKFLKIRDEIPLRESLAKLLG